MNERIIVDSNTDLFPFFCGKPSTEHEARALKAVGHYTTSKGAIEILSESKILGKSLSRYKSESIFSLNENTRKRMFITCFTSALNSEESMWQAFADAHKGCKIDFFFKNSFYDAFLCTDPIAAFDADGNEYKVAMRIIDAPGVLKHVCFTQHFSLVEYTTDLSNKTDFPIMIDGAEKNFTIAPYVGKSIQARFEYQNEARISMYLGAVDCTEIPFIQKIKIPFTLEEIENIVVTMGSCISDYKKKKLMELSRYNKKIILTTEQ